MAISTKKPSIPTVYVTLIEKGGARKNTHLTLYHVTAKSAKALILKACSAPKDTHGATA